MQQILWNDFKITPLIETARKENISDEIYFSKEYSDYISNSRLALINPSQEGSPQLYRDKKFQESSSALQIGTAVHQLFLQPQEFVLMEGLDKPSAKLGQVVDKAKCYRKQGFSIYDSIQNSTKDVGYFIASMGNTRIKTILQKGFTYYWKSKDLGSECVILSNSDTTTVKSCLSALYATKEVDKVMNVTDVFGSKIPSFNEDAMFIDIKVEYQNMSTILKFKMKADNWTIDPIGEILTLNDLKTTGKPLPFFMQDYGSFIKFHYARQMAAYFWVLKQYCINNYGVTEKWVCKSNMVVVETIPPYRAGCFTVPLDQNEIGIEEFFQSLKRVAYYELHGYDQEVEFI